MDKYLVVHNRTGRVLSFSGDKALTDFFGYNIKANYTVYQRTKRFDDLDWVNEHLEYLHHQHKKYMGKYDTNKDPMDLPYEQRLNYFRSKQIQKEIKKHKKKYGMER